MAEVSPAMKRQQAKMKSAWSAVKRQGLKGMAARQAVGKLLKGGAGPGPKVSLKPHAMKKRGRGRPKGSRDSKPRHRRRIAGSRRDRRDRTITLPFVMTAVDIARGDYRDAMAEAPRTFGTVQDLAGLTQSVMSSQQGIRPTFRDLWMVRLMLAAGVM